MTHSFSFKRFHLVPILLLAVAAVLLALPSFTRASSELVKVDYSPAVYYVYGGKRYAFPNEKVFFSWYSNFDSVQTISANELASYQLVKNVTYKPGVRLVKIATDPKIYVVTSGAVLRWVTTEQVAFALFGSSWSVQVDDIPDVFFTDYTIGAPINAVGDYQKETNITSIYQSLPQPVSSSATQGSGSGGTGSSGSTSGGTVASGGGTASIPPATGGTAAGGSAGGSVGTPASTGGSAALGTNGYATFTPSVPLKVTAVPGQVSKIANSNCQIYPDDNEWNRDISNDVVHPMNATWMNIFKQDFTKLHSAFNNPIGSVVDSSQPKITVACTPGVKYCVNSDIGTPMPIPHDAEIENINVTTGNFSGIGSDRHLWVVDKDACILYELFHAARIDKTTGQALTTNDVSKLDPNSWYWQADSAGVYPLNTNTLRPFLKPPDTASGLPMFVGLVKYEEIQANALNHALAFAIPRTQQGFIVPATTYSLKNYAADPLDPQYPPMGARLRLKASYDISAVTGQSRIILETLKKHGAYVADNGPAMYLNGSDGTYAYWPDLIQQLNAVPADAFEFIDGVVQH